LKKVQERFAADVPFLPMYHQQGTVLTSLNLRNFQFDALGATGCTKHGWPEVRWGLSFRTQRTSGGGRSSSVFIVVDVCRLIARLAGNTVPIHSEKGN
jgi:hypothetical protein